ncbi:PQQ-binding-like beta-propeller repeat protein [Pseudofrankia sp. DC12]|uniref:outer membrane protein assembly factor BamB family protein n=1 Tax=Pseudofrankia sp. DC12 TaxID=683315 RepID=UPI000696EB14|nr:PQQ-binding-like beta-propeller repeat protein [Pseudofrankia sp. DC12]
MEALGPSDPTAVGNYQLAAVLGTGGMGRVYLAFSPSGRRVAIKIIRPDLVQQRHIRLRFAREVAASRAVNGFFAAGVIDADLEANPPWLATAFIPGPSLNAAVRDAGALPAASVRALGAALAEALSAVHSAGLIHRDLKPANVLLAPDGPRLIDFGISALEDSGPLTHAGAVMGSPGYMSPEQINGETVGTATDIFAFGAVLTFAVTGTGPFGVGSLPSMLYRSVHNPPDLTKVPDELRPLLASCLDKDPARRPDLATILRELTGGRPAADMFPPGWLPAALAKSPIPTGPMPAFPLGPTPTPFGTTPVPVPGIGDRSVPSAARGPRPPASEATREVTVSSTPPDPRGGLATRLAPVPSEPSLGRTTPEPARQGPSRRLLLGGAIGTVGAAAAGTTVWRLLDDGSGRQAPPASPPGTVRWRFPTAGITLGRPRVAGDLVYAGSNDGTLHAVRTSSGAQAWKFTTGGAIGSTPLALGGIVYLGGDDGYLYAFDATTGRTRWKYHTDGIVHSPAAGGGLVHVGSADAHLYALDATSGAFRWKFSAQNDTHSPALAGDTVFVGSSDTNLYAVDAFSGNPHWAFPTAGAVSGMPAVLGGIVYFGSTDGSLYAVDAGSGKRAWKFDGVSVGAGPAIANGTVYMGGAQRSLYALGAADGRKVWTFPASGDVGAPVVVNGTVYFGTSDANLYAVDAATGAQKWKFTAASGVHSVAVTGETAYFGTEDNNLYAVSVR